MFTNTLCRGSILIACLLVMPTALPQSATLPSFGAPQAGLRPLGAHSIVDQYRSVRPNDSTGSAANADPRGRTAGEGLQQTVFMQNGVVPNVPNNGGMPLPSQFSPPPIQTDSLAGPPVIMPPTAPPRNLPSNPVPFQPSPSTGRFAPTQTSPTPSQDYAPMTQPSLANQFATPNNSCHVTGPSTYTAASASGCATVGYQVPAGYQAPPAYIAPPPPVAAAPIAPGPIPSAPIVTAPPIQAAPIAVTPTGAPVGSLVSFGQETYPVQVGPGLFGQPVAYVPGQKCRNWIRYLFP